MLNKRRKWFHSSREKLPLVDMSASSFSVSTFDLDLRFHVDSVEQPIKRNSVGSGHVSNSFKYHFGHGFVVFKDVQLRLALRRVSVGGYVIHM